MNKPNKTPGRPIILVAPSGSGKTTIAKRLLATFSQLQFSTSATTREPRPGEKDGVDYFFLSTETFDHKIEEDAFLEWEAYSGNKYGTLRAEVEKMMQKGYYPLLDIEVKGALNIKNMYGDKCLSVFIRPPSIEELKQRLQARGTESSEALQKRLQTAEEELTYANKFDRVVVNDELEVACREVINHILKFISNT